MQLPLPSQYRTVGVIGKRLTLTCTCIRKITKPFINRFKWNEPEETLYINYFVDTRTGALIVVKSNAYDVGVIGEPIILKGTIQRHGNYYGQAQTYLSRVRVMEPCAD